MDIQVLKDIIINSKIASSYGNASDSYRSVVDFEDLWWSKSNLLRFRDWHQVGTNTDIFLIFSHNSFVQGDFFTADRKYYHSTIFLEDRICFFYHVNTTGWDKEEDLRSELLYSEIEDIEIDDACVRFFIYGSTKTFDVSSPYFGKRKLDSNSITLLVALFRDIIAGVNQNVSNNEEHYNEFCLVIQTAFDSGDYSASMTVLDEYSHLSHYLLYQWYHGNILIQMGDYDTAHEVLSELINTTIELENEYWYSRAKILYSVLCEKSGNPYQAAIEFDQGYEHYDQERTDDIYDKRRSQMLYNDYIQSFNTLPYRERKVILVSNAIQKHKTDIFTVLNINNLPAINFPPHHPVKNELYIGHPYNDNSYISIENYDYELLTDRINEYCYLLQCLGAENIMIENIKGEDAYNSTNVNSSTGVDTGGIKVGVEVDVNSSKKNTKNEQSTLKIAKNQSFNPTKKPYVPEGLVWFPHEASWQRLVEQRMQGNLLEYNEMISSQNNQVLTSNELDDLKVDVNLFFVNVNVDRKKEMESEIRNNSITEWKVSVKFRPISNIVQESIHTLIDADVIEEEDTVIDLLDTEKEYLEEYLFMLEDGNISERELRLLDRHRIKLGISEERAIELIESTKEKYTEEELEFIEEVKLTLEAGELSDRELSLLIRLGNRLSLDENRCMELINAIKL